VIMQFFVYTLVVTCAFAGLVHTAVQLLHPQQVGAFTATASLRASSVRLPWRVPTSPPPVPRAPVVYRALDASVLVDVFGVMSTRNETGE
jgi:hypothetical protein